MKTYCENKQLCRHKQIVGYFGENVSWDKCDMKCDNCWSCDTEEDADEPQVSSLLKLSSDPADCPIFRHAAALTVTKSDTVFVFCSA